MVTDRKPHFKGRVDVIFKNGPDIIKQKLPENNGGYTALSFGKTHSDVYDKLSTDHPIDLTRYQIANNYMGRMGLMAQSHIILKNLFVRYNTFFTKLYFKGETIFSKFFFHISLNYFSVL